MSAVTKAKSEQGYTTTPSNCGNCKHKTSDRALPAWMQRENDARGTRYTVEVHGIERNVRCGIGKFAVKKTATCNLYEAKPQ